MYVHVHVHVRMYCASTLRQIQLYFVFIFLQMHIIITMPTFIQNSLGDRFRFRFQIRVIVAGTTWRNNNICIKYIRERV